MEEFRDIPGYEGYQVSNLGRVKSFKNGKYGLRKEGKLLKPRVDTGGYLFVNLYKNGEDKSFRVHKLVAMTFLGHKPCGHRLVVDHIDNNGRKNNSAENLQLISQRENASKDREGSSKFTGVSLHKTTKKWSTKIRINNKQIYLGSFKDEEEAGEIYQLALKHINEYENDNKRFREFLKEKI